MNSLQKAPSNMNSSKIITNSCCATYGGAAVVAIVFLMLEFLSVLGWTSTTNANSNLLLNGGFEEGVGWDAFCKDDAQGERGWVKDHARSGVYSMRLRKTNAVGFIHLRTTQPIPVKAGIQYAFRGWFHSENAPLSSILLFRVTTEQDGEIRYDDIDRSAGLASMSFTVNTRPDHWLKRVQHFKPKADQSVYLHVLLWGNPATVWLDDLEFTTGEYIDRCYTRKHGYPYSKEEVYQVLEKRTPSTAQLKSLYGQSALYLNERVVPPVIFKEQPFTGYGVLPDLFAYDDFGAAGIPIAMRALVLSPFVHTRKEKPLWVGKGKYDWEELERTLLLPLRQDPHVCLILDTWLRGAYEGWAEEHPDDILRNQKGEGGVLRSQDRPGGRLYERSTKGDGALRAETLLGALACFQGLAGGYRPGLARHCHPPDANSIGQGRDWISHSGWR